MKKLLFAITLSVLTFSIYAQRITLQGSVLPEYYKTVEKITKSQKDSVLNSITGNMPVVDSDYERIDVDYMFPERVYTPIQDIRVVNNDTIFIKRSYNEYHESNKNGWELRTHKSSSCKTCLIDVYIREKYNWFYISKRYYSTGGIKEKGVQLDYRNSGRVGLWYYYDEYGNVTNIIDYDEGYNFTFADVISYVIDNNIPFWKHYEFVKTINRDSLILFLRSSPASSDFPLHTGIQINKSTNGVFSTPVWRLTYIDFNNNELVTIELYGKTGEFIRALDRKKLTRKKEYED